MEARRAGGARISARRPFWRRLRGARRGPPTWITEWLPVFLPAGQRSNAQPMALRSVDSWPSMPDRCERVQVAASPSPLRVRRISRQWWPRCSSSPGRSPQGPLIAIGPDPESDELIRNDGFAFLLGVIFDQGIRYERAWRAPYELQQRLGHLDPARIVADPEAVRRTVAGPPALHRY